MSRIPTGTQLAAYRNEIPDCTEGDDPCVTVSALLRHIDRVKAAHAEGYANTGTGRAPRCVSYVEEIARLAGAGSSPLETADGPDHGGDRALKWAMETIS